MIETSNITIRIWNLRRAGAILMFCLFPLLLLIRESHFSHFVPESVQAWVFLGYFIVAFFTVGNQTCPSCKKLLWAGGIWHKFQGEFCALCGIRSNNCSHSISAGKMVEPHFIHINFCTFCGVQLRKLKEKDIHKNSKTRKKIDDSKDL